MRHTDINRDWLEYQLYLSFLEARKRKLRTADEFMFEMDWQRNIALLADDILEGRYRPSRSIAFIVKKPVVREIFAAPFRDRVVHHFLFREVYDWWDRRLVYGSSSCRKGKGVLFGIKKLRHDMAAVSENYTKNAYVLKMDIKGYFMSLPRKELFKRAEWGLKRQFPDMGSTYRLLRDIWKEVIFDDPVRGVKLRPPIEDWNLLDPGKCLLHQPEGLGIVIGNLSSQLLSNIYLDLLDRFIMFDLGYKYYGRYVDDFYIVVTEEQFEQAKKDIHAIEEFLKGLGLTLHPKKRYIQPVKHGCAFLGVMVYPHATTPTRRFKDNFYTAAQEYAWGLSSDASIASYLGFLKNVDGKKLCKNVFDEFGWDYKY